MRLLELRLLAFGPFSDVALTFERQSALHLVYGPNEAGKSTALRAINGLFYGIPLNTGDAHLHRMADLRIGARLASGDRSLCVVRRKGSKNTLLDESGAAIDEAALESMLGGVDEGTFKAMFGLDHESLRRGAEALLQGRGAVGESLFDAGVGGRGIQLVLDELTQEADDLFRPKGQKPKINRVLAELKEARRRKKDSELSADAWRTQIQGLDADREERQSTLGQQRQLAAEQSSLQRALRALPQLAKWRERRARRAALEAVVILPAGARDRRLAAQRDLDDCARQSERLRQEIAKLSETRDQLEVPESLVALGDAAVEELNERLGVHRKAAADLPKRQGELQVIRSEVESLLRGLDSDSVEAIEKQPVSAATQARVRKLANEKSGLLAALEHERSRTADLQSRLQHERQSLEQQAPARDTRGAERALAAAVGALELPPRLAKLRRELERRRDAGDDQLRSLGLWSGTLDELRRLPMPPAPTVDLFAARFDDVQRRRAEADRAARDLEKRRRLNQRDRGALEEAGSVPSEGELAAARGRRDLGWSSMRELLLAGKAASADAVGAYETALHRSDDLADRLRREADRVAQRAALTAESAALQEESTAIDADVEALSVERTALQTEWSHSWAALGFEPMTPAEMKEWLRRVEEILAHGERVDETAAEVEELEVQIANRHQALVAELVGFGDGGDADDLPTLVDAARTVVDDIAAAARRRDRASVSIAELESELAKATRQRDLHQQALGAWQSAWEKSVGPLGLGAEASPEEAQAVLDQLSRLAAKIDEMRRIEKRAATMEQDAESFAAQVSSMVGGCLPQLRHQPVAEAAEHLVRAHRQARNDRREHQRIDAEVGERRDLLAAHDERRESAERSLAGLLGDAGVAAVAALEECERRSQEASDLDRQIAEIEDEILASGEGAGVEELIRQTEGLDVDMARARLAELEAEIEQLRESQEAVIARISRNEAGLEHMERERGAADAAAEVEERLAALHGHVEHYMRVKLASAVLDREVERYRRENQGPVLGRANELFPRLTQGRYSALRVGFDKSDEAVLHCLRADGREVDVEGLSDGTRDQLYLALRLATLEHYAQSNEVMPLVLDDILIHFDDQRAAAALEVLGNFADTTQVLFFTHHARLRELARDVVPAERLVEHDLTGIALSNGPR